MKKHLQVNVSGGRTSAYMAWWLKQNCSEEYDFLFIFANTGFEHPDTYRFLQDVDRNFDLNLVMVECVVNPEKRKGTTHKVVDYNSLARNGEPFEEEIRKYGISNMAFKHCNREMKFNPMASYAKTLWPEGDFEVALGIRPDEPRRVNEKTTKDRIVYPLVKWHPHFHDYPDKPYILEWWRQYTWDLKIPEYLGNCLTCYKKSDNKLNMVYRKNPGYFDFFARMEQDYGHIKPITDPTPGKRCWWRGYRTTAQLLSEFDSADMDTSGAFKDDESGGCSESCEPYEMVQLSEIEDGSANG